jgi:ubiquinone biosynthesis protein
MLGATLGNFTRLIGIARILARHDALWPLERLGVAPLALLLGRMLGGPRRAKGRPGERLARALEEIGPGAIKLGQALAVRSDLVGEEAAQDLTRLQDRLPPFPFAQARAAVEAELGGPLETLFAEFGEEPVAAASIAQVHRARTLDGQDVAVKILRPDIEQRFARDLSLLYWIARLAERTAPMTRRLKPVAVVAEFEKWVRTEMDFRIEAASASELAEYFPAGGNEERFRVPRVHWELTGQRVLVIEWIEGVRIDDLEAIDRMGMDRRDITARSARVFFLQVFRDGFFHADMHPGNMFLTAEGELVPVDFGIMGRVDIATRRYLADMLSGFLQRRYAAVADVHFRAGYVPRDQDREAFTQALRSIGEPLHGLPLNRISLGRLLAQLFQTTEKFKMQTRPELLLLQKTLLVAEGVGRKLDPDVNMWIMAQPLIEDWMLANRGPEARLREFAANASDTLERLPRLVRRAEEVLDGLAARDPYDMARERRRFLRDGLLAAACVLAAAALLAAVLLD